MQSGGVFGMDATGGLFGMSGSFFGGWRSVMFESPGQSGRPTLQANAVRGPSPGPRPMSRSVSPSRWWEVLCQLEVEVLWLVAYQSNGRGRGLNGAGRPVVIQRNIAAEVTVKAVEPQ